MTWWVCCLLDFVLSQVLFCADSQITVRVIAPPNPRFINGQPFWWFWTQQGGLKFTFRWVQFHCWLFSSKHRRDCKEGSLHYHHHHQMCVFTVRKLTWCLLNHSCFLLWLQQCPLGRVLSAPSPTSSVSGKSPEQQETPLSCGKDSMYKKYLLNSCLRVIALQCVGQKSFHEQTREEWHFIPRMMEKSVSFTPVSIFSLKLALTTLSMSPSSLCWITNTNKPSKASKNLNKQKKKTYV